jgi:hypothetical protein
MFLLCLHVVLDGAVSGSNEKGNELKKMKFYKHLFLGIFDNERIWRKQYTSRGQEKGKGVE